MDDIIKTHRSTLPKVEIPAPFLTLRAGDSGSVPDLCVGLLSLALHSNSRGVVSVVLVFAKLKCSTLQNCRSGFL